VLPAFRACPKALVKLLDLGRSPIEPIHVGPAEAEEKEKCKPIVSSALGALTASSSDQAMIRLARQPVLNDPIQLIGPASLIGNSRETFHKSGTDGANPIPSSSESKPAPLWWVSSQFRAIAGIWPCKRGTIDRPAIYDRAKNRMRV